LRYGGPSVTKLPKGAVGPDPVIVSDSQFVMYLALSVDTSDTLEVKNPASIPMLAIFGVLAPIIVLTPLMPVWNVLYARPVIFEQLVCSNAGRLTLSNRSSWPTHVRMRMTLIGEKTGVPFHQISGMQNS